jgi:hypothetical protein
LSREPNITLEQAKERLKSAVAPRVTEESIKAKIASVEYSFIGTSTVCMITMVSGFKFFGTSTPASPSNYDTEIGQRYAYDNAFKQIWTHEGYLLRERLSQQEAHDGK